MSPAGRQCRRGLCVPGRFLCSGVGGQRHCLGAPGKSCRWTQRPGSRARGAPPIATASTHTRVRRLVGRGEGLTLNFPAWCQVPFLTGAAFLGGCVPAVGTQVQGSQGQGVFPAGWGPLREQISECTCGGAGGGSSEARSPLFPLHWGGSWFGLSCLQGC